MLELRFGRFLLAAVFCFAPVAFAAAQGVGRPQPQGVQMQDVVNQVRELKSEIDKALIQLPPNVRAALEREIAAAIDPSQPRPRSAPRARLPPDKEKLRVRVLELKKQVERLMAGLRPDVQIQLRRELTSGRLSSPTLPLPGAQGPPPRTEPSGRQTAPPARHPGLPPGTAQAGQGTQTAPPRTEPSRRQTAPPARHPGLPPGTAQAGPGTRSAPPGLSGEDAAPAGPPQAPPPPADTGQLADLAITSVTMVPPNATSQTPFVLHVTVTNGGTAPMTFEPIFQSTSFGFMPILSGGDFANDVSPAFVTVVLAPGESKVYSVQPREAGTLPGARTWTFTVDPENAVQELNEENNQYDFTTTIVEGPPVLPDLEVVGYEISPADPKASGSFSLSLQIKNNGDAEARFPFPTMGQSSTVFRWSVDYFGSASFHILTETESMFRIIPPGQTVVYDGGSRSCQGRTGTFTGTGTLDPQNRVVESNEENNWFTFGFVISPDNVGDLIVSDVTVEPPNPSSGTDFVLKVTVTNQDAASISLHSVSAKREGGAPFPFPKVEAQGSLPTNLDPGESKVFDVRPTDLWFKMAGTWTWTARVETDALEADTENNYKSITFTIE